MQNRVGSLLRSAKITSHRKYLRGYVNKKTKKKVEFFIVYIHFLKTLRS